MNFYGDNLSLRRENMWEKNVDIVKSVDKWYT